MRMHGVHALLVAVMVSPITAGCGGSAPGGLPLPTVPHAERFADDTLIYFVGEWYE